MSKGPLVFLSKKKGPLVQRAPLKHSDYCRPLESRLGKNTSSYTSSASKSADWLFVSRLWMWCQIFSKLLGSHKCEKNIKGHWECQCGWRGSKEVKEVKNFHGTICGRTHTETARRRGRTKTVASGEEEREGDERGAWDGSWGCSDDGFWELWIFQKKIMTIFFYHLCLYVLTFLIQCLELSDTTISLCKKRYLCPKKIYTTILWHNNTHNNLCCGPDQEKKHNKKFSIFMKLKNINIFTTQI